MRASYAWAMRNGSMILFAVAALLFLVGLGRLFIGFRPGTPLELFIGAVLSALSSAAFPLFGALVVHRWDVRRASSTANQP